MLFLGHLLLGNLAHPGYVPALIWKVEENPNEKNGRKPTECTHKTLFLHIDIYK